MVGTSSIFRKTYSLDVFFNYTSGLTKGAPVHFAGHEIGKVANIEFAGPEDPRVRVTITIDQNVVIRQDTNAFINILGFMGETYIELSAGSREGVPLKEGESLAGNDPVVMMEIVKRATEIIEEFEKTSVSLNKMLDNLNGIIGNNEQDMDAIFDNLNVTSENLKLMTNDLKSHPWKLLKKGEE